MSKQHVYIFVQSEIISVSCCDENGIANYISPVTSDNDPLLPCQTPAHRAGLSSWNNYKSSAFNLPLGS